MLVFYHENLTFASCLPSPLTRACRCIFQGNLFPLVDVLWGKVWPSVGLNCIPIFNVVRCSYHYPVPPIIFFVKREAVFLCMDVEISYAFSSVYICGVFVWDASVIYSLIWRGWVNVSCVCVCVCVWGGELFPASVLFIPVMFYVNFQ